MSMYTIYIFIYILHDSALYALPCYHQPPPTTPLRDAEPGETEEQVEGRRQAKLLRHPAQILEVTSFQLEPATICYNLISFVIRPSLIATYNK